MFHSWFHFALIAKLPSEEAKPRGPISLLLGLIVLLEGYGQHTRPGAACVFRGNVLTAMQLQLLLFLLGSIWTVQCSGHELRIPKLIHRNYMAGAAALQAATMGPQPDFRAHWLASCTVWG